MKEFTTLPKPACGNSPLFATADVLICGNRIAYVQSPRSQPSSRGNCRSPMPTHKSSVSFRRSTPYADLVINDGIFKTFTLNGTSRTNGISRCSSLTLIFVFSQNKKYTGLSTFAVGMFQPFVFFQRCSPYIEENSRTTNGHSSSFPRRINVGHSR